MKVTGKFEDFFYFFITFYFCVWGSKEFTIFVCCSLSLSVLFCGYVFFNCHICFYVFIFTGKVWSAVWYFLGTCRFHTLAYTRPCQSVPWNPGKSLWVFSVHCVSFCLSLICSDWWLRYEQNLWFHSCILLVCSYPEHLFVD